MKNRRRILRSIVAENLSVSWLLRHVTRSILEHDLNNDHEKLVSKTGRDNLDSNKFEDYF